MSIKATPRTIYGSSTSATPFFMPDLPADTSTTSYERVIQSVVVYNRESVSKDYKIVYGANSTFDFSLADNETFVVENIKFVQRGDDNANTKIGVYCQTSSSTLGGHVFITYIDLAIPKTEIPFIY